MKGVIFTEFLSFTEEQFGLAMVDHLITATSPESGGAYTAVGTYSAEELLAMIGELSRQSGIEVNDLVKSFGERLFQHFVVSHASTLGRFSTAEQLLASVEDHIHVEVRKLYPGAELPTIGFKQVDPSNSEVLYQSTRPLADLAEGLIVAAIRHFGDEMNLVREDIPPGDGTHAVFRLSRQ